MAFRKFNMHSVIRLRITDYGRKILSDSGYMFYDEDENGLSTWYIYELAQAFGHRNLLADSCDENLRLFDANAEVFEDEEVGP